MALALGGQSPCVPPHPQGAINRPLRDVLIFGGGGELGSDDGGWLVEEGIFYALAMFGESIGWQHGGLEVATFAHLFGFGKFTTCDMATEGQDYFLLLRFGIDAH